MRQHYDIVGNITDSGRSQVMPGEKNDCTVRALANALEIPYLEAYGMMLGSGRKFGKGANCSELYGRLFPTLPCPRMTVARYIQFIAYEGNWIIRIRKHVFAVKDKTILDINPMWNINRHVLQAWRVK